MKREQKAEVAPAKEGSWKVTEELDSIQCPICKGYNRLSISSDKTHVYCAECGDRITEAYLKTQCFDLRVALERQINPAPAQSGQREPDYTGYGSTIRALQEMGYSLGSNNSLWWLHGGEHIAIRNGQHVVVADMITNLLEEKAELLEALRDTVNELEYATSEIETCDMAERTMRVFGKARTILAKIGGNQ